MRKSLLIVAVLIVSVIVSYILWADRLSAGQVTLPQLMPDRNRVQSPAIAKALDRKLPDDFSIAGGLQKTLHRMGDETRVPIFLDRLSFQMMGVREDLPIRAKLGGKTLREALRVVQAQCDPPLAFDMTGEFVLFEGPKISPINFPSYSHDVGRLCGTPVQDQELLTSIRDHLDGCPWLISSERTTMKLGSGLLTEQMPLLSRYELARYLNRRHAIHGVLAFAVRAGIVCAAGIALLGVIFFIQRRLRERRRRREGLCRRCGYDLRASTERCPECGLAFG